MEQPAQGYNTTLALHVAQEDIPLASSPSDSRSAVPEGSTSRAGYGPLSPASASPLQRLSQQHLHRESEYNLLCAPLSNGNWHQRWERMCVASPPAGYPVGSSSSMLDGRYDSLADGAEDPEEAAQRMREAELWRFAGAFRRGEVNATRSGWSHSFFPKHYGRCKPTSGIPDAQMKLKPSSRSRQTGSSSIPTSRVSASIASSLFGKKSLTQLIYTSRCLSCLFLKIRRM